ncbi:MAG: hypothetical protein LC737_03930, partial [Chloroflexi bacterium]|nr:hypothetical protein [Chloroflexota bacterium]
GDWQRAAAYAMRAGERSLRVHAQREASDYYQLALDALTLEPGAPRTQVCDAIIGWAQAAFKYKPFPEVLERLAHAERLARELGDERRLVLALNAIAKVHLTSGYATRGIPTAVEAYALARKLEDEQLALTPSCLAAYARLDLDPRGTVTYLAEVLTLARKYGDQETEAYALGIEAMARARLGEFAQAQVAIQRALNVVSAIDAPFADADIHLFAGWSYLDIGDGQHALQFAQRGVAKALAAENMDCICFGYACVGFGNLQMHNLPAANASFAESARRSHASGAAPIESIAQAGLAITNFLKGGTHDVDEIERALAQSRSLGNPFIAAQLAQMLGEIAMQADQLTQAEQHLNAALAYYHPTHMAPYIARVMRLLADVYQRQGRTAAAEQAHAVAEQAAAACERV